MSKKLWLGILVGFALLWGEAIVYSLPKQRLVVNYAEPFCATYLGAGWHPTNKPAPDKFHTWCAEDRQ